MNILEQLDADKIIKIPLNGSPVVIDEIPEGMTPQYSGAFVLLAGEQVGDTNLNVKQALKLIIKGDAVILNQKVWHENNA